MRTTIHDCLRPASLQASALQIDVRRTVRLTRWCRLTVGEKPMLAGLGESNVIAVNVASG